MVTFERRVGVADRCSGGRTRSVRGYRGPSTWPADKQKVGASERRSCLTSSSTVRARPKTGCPFESIARHNLLRRIRTKFAYRGASRAGGRFKRAQLQPIRPAEAGGGQGSARERADDVGGRGDGKWSTRVRGEWRGGQRGCASSAFAFEHRGRESEQQHTVSPNTTGPVQICVDLARTRAWAGSGSEADQIGHSSKQA